MGSILDIIDLGMNGDGIARTEDGRPVFVPLTLAGDRVEAHIAPDHEGVLRGRMIRLIEAGLDRAVPPCRHFGICGGCALQHLSGDSYRAFKIRMLVDALEKAGVAPPETIESVFIPDHTRRRANFACRIVKGRAMIGFHERRSATIRDVPDCLLITEDVRHVMEGMRRHLPAIAGDGNKVDLLIQCVEGQAEVGLTGKIAPGWEAQDALGMAMRELNLARISLRARDYAPYETMLEARPFIKSFGALTVALAPGSFLQPSVEGEQALTDLVMSGISGVSTVTDLFCGHGTFTGPLSERAAVRAFDNAPDAIAALRRAGGQADVRDLFKNPLSCEELASFDGVVLDPPRAGAKAQCVELCRSRVERVVYVSCNPQTFARDASVLKERYDLSALTLVDQFIWSPHTEVVGVFHRRG